MCGLWGAYSTSLTNAEKENALFLGFLSQTRGMDSTGVCTLGHGKKNKLTIRVRKAVGHATDFMLSGPCSQAFDSTRAFLIMGHCRAATLGAVNERNAQPVEEGPVILCHNGSIKHFLEDKDNPGHTDSRELARRMWHKGMVPALKDTNGEAWALTWIDLRNRTFNLSRNTWRTLWVMRGAGTIYWASERWILKAMAMKANEHAWPEPEMVPIHTKITYDIGTLRETRTALELTTSVPSIGLFCSKCNKGRYICECHKIIVPFTPDPQVNAAAKSAVKDLMDKRSHIFDRPKNSLDELCKGFVYKGWMGSVYSVSHVFDRLKSGCDMCKRQCVPREVVHWIGTDAFVCDDCTKNNPNYHLYVKDVPSYESSLIRKA